MSPTSVCEGLDVICEVNVDTLSILHFLENDPNEPHGNKVIPVTEFQEQNIINSCHVVEGVTVLCGEHTASTHTSGIYLHFWFFLLITVVLQGFLVL